MLLSLTGKQCDLVKNPSLNCTMQIWSRWQIPLSLPLTPLLPEVILSLTTEIEPNNCPPAGSGDNIAQEISITVGYQ